MVKEKEVLSSGAVNEEIVIEVPGTSTENKVEVKSAAEVVEKAQIITFPKKELTLNDLKDAMVFLAFKTLEPSEVKEFKMRLGE